jgi:nitrate reductase alpha subunit
VKLKLSVLEDGEQAHEVVDVGLPYFGGVSTPHFKSNAQNGEVNFVKVPAVRLRLGKEGEHREALVATVFDLQVAQYGIDRGLGSGARATTTTPPTRRPGPRASPARRATRSSPWPASSPRTRTRRMASRWSSSARR